MIYATYVDTHTYIYIYSNYAKTKVYVCLYVYDLCVYIYIGREKHKYHNNDNMYSNNSTGKKHSNDI